MGGLPARSQIVEGRLDTFDTGLDAAAARKIEPDLARGLFGGLEGDGEQRQDRLRVVLADALRLPARRRYLTSPARMTASCICAEMTARSSASKAVSLST
jgi:hypothetical protein